MPSNIVNPKPFQITKAPLLLPNLGPELHVLHQTPQFSFQVLPNATTLFPSMQVLLAIVFAYNRRHRCGRIPP